LRTPIKLEAKYLRLPAAGAHSHTIVGGDPETRTCQCSGQLDHSSVLENDETSGADRQ
jgi:hypothetical protein